MGLDQHQFDHAAERSVVSANPERIACMEICRLDAEGARCALPKLVALLQNVVDDGASVGFLLPLAAEEATVYWQSVIDALATPHRILLVAREGERILGTVQLDLVTRANGRHRAEVMKLLVHTDYRRRGIGRALMAAIEEEARRAGRTTLVLDTRVGDAGEALYAGLGYVRVGEIPNYVCNETGALESTAVYYKLL
jgi:acetyltransferase